MPPSFFSCATFRFFLQPLFQRRCVFLVAAFLTSWCRFFFCFPLLPLLFTLIKLTSFPFAHNYFRFFAIFARFFSPVCTIKHTLTNARTPSRKTCAPCTRLGGKFKGAVLDTFHPKAASSRGIHRTQPVPGVTGPFSRRNPFSKRTFPSLRSHLFWPHFSTLKLHT